MRIVCPSCVAEYDVPDSLVTAGRVVRCARCGGEWAPVEARAAEPERVPPSPAATSVDDPPIASDEPVGPTAPPVPPIDSPAVAEASPRPPSAMDRLALQSARPSSPLRLRLAWLASLVVLALLGWAAYAWRAEIVATWPPSGRMYAIFGVQSLPDRTP
jgi:predicted Zn finger-like uncharacterized protein